MVLDRESARRELRDDPVTKKRLHTNAKVNLFLSVLGRRPDGYHEIETIFHTIGLADSLTFTPSTTGGIEIDMRSDAGPMEMPPPEENLVHRAAELLRERRSGVEDVCIEIVKRIPIGAGLGGGSGNAAGALVALNALWDVGLNSGELGELAGNLGADVPYCITGGTALATGRGEQVTPLPQPAPLWLVLGLSDHPLYTSDVYGNFDPKRDAAGARSLPLAQALERGENEKVAALVHNDLERPAFRLRPELEDGKAAMLEAGATGALMAGSGPTIFAIARDARHAATIAGRIEPAFDRVEVTSSKPECIERLD
ncbi:MAG: 4-(cytidine 5'-diphospho)-2-C-methyl-D-erythritol kinase [Actinomycetota bacterium]|nr:4-(cytidine 5'-diphospho)-2-C-methyl-D-erythritol kinase [Actinomycetota bacterium]